MACCKNLLYEILATAKDSGGLAGATATAFVSSDPKKDENRLKICYYLTWLFL
jgi:hypothetical protein